ncbi:MAG TPA: excinuclease ABC subunit UvrC, partial [Gemmatimonadales bacterium]|nr:excinuclease ABC subunit UvrC [Gemmatimonadales bacterium]
MPDLTDALARKLETLPDGPGVYLWRDAAGEVLYVGKAKRLRSRVRSYVAADFATSPKNQLLQRLINDVETIVVGSEAESLILENNLIKEYRPRFNVRLKDDKSYPSIAVTLAEPFPRVLVTRRRNIPGAKYFGPYTDVAQLRRTLAIIRRLYTVRSCADDLPREQRERPCLDYHIGRCRAPCVGWQTEADYQAMVRDVVEFLEGRTGDVRQRVREAMLVASEREDYERAANLRDALRWLERLEDPSSVELLGSGDADAVGFARDGDDAVGVLMRVREGRVVSREHRFLEGVEEETDEAILSAFLVRYYLPAEDRARRIVLPFPPDDFETLREILPEADWTVPQRGTASRWRELADQNARHLLESLRIESFETEERAEDPVYALGRDLGLSVVPRSLVCVDISHNQGRDIVGSLVWFEAGRPKKSEYRKFKIKELAEQDDFAAIHEVVTRYLTRRRDQGDPLP